MLRRAFKSRLPRALCLSKYGMCSNRKLPWALFAILETRMGIVRHFLEKRTSCGGSGLCQEFYLAIRLNLWQIIQQFGRHFVVYQFPIFHRSIFLTLYPGELLWHLYISISKPLSRIMQNFLSDQQQLSLITRKFFLRSINVESLTSSQLSVPTEVNIGDPHRLCSGGIVDMVGARQRLALYLRLMSSNIACCILTPQKPPSAHWYHCASC